jgi:hypothetical protein
MSFSKGFWRALPHRKAAVAAFPMLAVEGGLTVFFDGVLGHIGLLYLQGSPRAQVLNHHGTNCGTRVGQAPAQCGSRLVEITAAKAERQCRFRHFFDTQRKTPDFR